MIHTIHAAVHSNKANMKGWLWWPNDIRGPCGPKASLHLSYRWGKTPKNLTQETCPEQGSNPGPLRNSSACYRLLHSGGQICILKLINKLISRKLIYKLNWNFLFLLFSESRIFSINPYCAKGLGDRLYATLHKMPGNSATHFVYFWSRKTLPYTHVKATSYIPQQGQSLHIWTSSLSTTKNKYTIQFLWVACVSRFATAILRGETELALGTIRVKPRKHIKTKISSTVL